MFFMKLVTIFFAIHVCQCQYQASGGVNYFQVLQQVLELTNAQQDIGSVFQDYRDKIIGNAEQTLIEGLGAASPNDTDSLCLNHTGLFVKALLRRENWALRMIDAFGKPGPGLMDYSFNWVGNFDECIAIQSMEYKNFTTKEGPTSPYGGKYCTSSFALGPPSSLGQIALSLGLCVPDTCSQKDISGLVNAVTGLLPLNMTIPEATVVCQEKTLEFTDTALAVTIVGAVFASLLLIATMYDVLIQHVLSGQAVRSQKSNSDLKSSKGITNRAFDHPVSMDEVDNGYKKAHYNGTKQKCFTDIDKTPSGHVEMQGSAYKPGLPGKLLLAFSVYTNAPKILNTKQPQGTLTCMNGIRFLSMTWVILGHILSFGMSQLGNAATIIPRMMKRFTFQVVLNATVSVDTFFVLSGLLVSYLSLREMKKRGGASKFNWGLFYFHRYWRLTPPYMLLLMLYVPTLKYWTNGPFWPQNGIDADECKDSWWTNLLYINNVYTSDPEKMCMGWSWYLANDMQFYAVSPVMLIPLFYSPLAGGIVCLVLILTNCICSDVVANHYDINPNIMFSSCKCIAVVACYNTSKPPHILCVPDPSAGIGSVFLQQENTDVLERSGNRTLKEYCESRDTKSTRGLRCNYIPKDIPNGITAVQIVDFKVINKHLKINSSNFQSENWENVEYLELSYDVSDYSIEIYLQSKCFQGLKLLQELHIHLKIQIILDPETFTGLTFVRVLDMSTCVRLSLKALLPSLCGRNKLPAIESLKFSGLNKYKEPPIAIDAAFAEAMRDKNVTHLDFSHTKISDIDITALIENMKNLQIFNISYSFISHITLDYSMNSNELVWVNVWDASHVQNPINGNYEYINQSLRVSHINEKMRYVFNPEIVNFTASVPKFFSISMKNCTFWIDVPLHFRTKTLIASQNNIKRLDAKMFCRKYNAFTIKHIDSAQNGLEFLHPSILSCIPNTESLDLSTNQLFKMNQENQIMFGKLFTSLQHLKSVHMSFNNLESIPKGFFEQNHELEKIDLSHNQLDQVTFTLHHLKNLMSLDLQFNNIKILDKVSLNVFDSLGEAEVHLKPNPISCSECESYRFLQWLTRANSLNKIEPDLYCITEIGEHRNINPDTTKLVQGICKRKVIIISASVSSGLTVFIVAVTITVIYKRRKRAKREANKNNCLRNLAEGECQFEFVAFLSYSNEDSDFVKDCVKDKLNENLQLMTGIERDLVCTGDAYLRPGFLILDETVRCMERATVVISIVSNSYCDSRYCHNELDQAYRLNKPIILMLKEHVDENNMMPTMKMLFKNNVRILWTIENNEYVLKTTWENVCESILDIIARNV